MPRGEISGLTLAINAGSIENAGNLLATQALTLNASGQIANVLGTVKAGGYLSITAAGNLENLSGLIQGADVSINAQTIENVTLVRRGSELIIPAEFTGVLRVETSQAVNKAVLGFWGISLNPSGSGNTLLTSLFVKAAPDGGTGQGNGYFIEPGTAATGAHTDVAAQQAEISATGGVKLNAAKDVNNVGGKLAAANGDLALNAGGDINVDAQALSSTQGSVSTVSHVKSTLSGAATSPSTRAATPPSRPRTSPRARTRQIAAGGQVTLGAAQDEYHEHWSHKSCAFMDQLQDLDRQQRRPDRRRHLHQLGRLGRGRKQDQGHPHHRHHCERGRQHQAALGPGQRALGSRREQRLLAVLYQEELVVGLFGSASGSHRQLHHHRAHLRLGGERCPHRLARGFCAQGLGRPGRRLDLRRRAERPAHRDAESLLPPGHHREVGVLLGLGGEQRHGLRDIRLAG